MFRIFQVIYYLGCVGGTLALGFPFALFMRRNELQKNILPTALLAGGAVSMIVSYWLNFLGLPMRAVWILLAAVCAVAWGGAIRLGLFTTEKRRMEKHSVVLLLLCIFAGALALLPTLIYQAGFPYGDEYTYISIADYLLDHSYRMPVEMDQYSPWLTQIYLYQTAGFRMGAQFLLSLWTAIFQQSYSIFLYGPVSGLSLCLYGAAVWQFTEQIGEMSRDKVCYGVIFSVFNIPFAVWSAIFGFLPQLTGLAYMVASLGQIIRLLRGRQPFKAVDCAEGVLYIAAMALSYSEIVPFFVLFVVALYFWENRTQKGWKKTFALLSLTAFISLAVLGKYAVDMIKALTLQFGAVVGAAQTLNWFSYIACWLSSAPVQYSFSMGGYPPVVHLFFVCLTCVLFSLLVFGVIRNRDHQKMQHLKTGAVLCIPLAALLVYFAIIATNPFGTGYGNTWSLYKLAQYVFPLIGCFLFPYFADVFAGKGRIRKTLLVLFPVGFCVMGICNAANYSQSVTASMRQYTNGAENPLFAYIEFAEKYKDETRTINLCNLPMEHRKVLTYFMRSNRLASDWSSDGYFSSNPYPDPTIDSEGIFLVYNPLSEGAVLGLVEMPEEQCVLIDETNGVGVQEMVQNQGSWTWNDPESEYKIVNYTGQNEITVAVELSCGTSTPGSYVEVYINDQHIKDVAVDSQHRAPLELTMDITSGESGKLRFVYVGETLQEPNGGRNLALCVWNFTASATNNNI